MALTLQQKNLHLLSRVGFGVEAKNLAALSQTSNKELFALLVKDSKSNSNYLDVADNTIKGLIMGISDVVKAKKGDLTKEQKQQIQKQSREDIKSLNIAWMNEMVNSTSQLREKMSLFWHGHFACRQINIYYQQLLLKDIRDNALGNFGDLLKAVSKSASMLSFLNAQQNKKEHPNENFAREVMELFTMGRGNYSENDIKEAARAFTGWGFNLKGEFVFRKFQHDNGNKTIFNKTGNFNGDDVLNMLLEQKQTAKYITQKIYKFYVNDNVNAEHVSWLSDRFYQSNYNIQQLLNDIFSSKWFYDEKNIGTKIKSPVELLVGIRRMLPMKIENEEVLLIFQRALGQLLFFPPNVAGWPGGKNWIDSSALMLRLRVPQLFLTDEEIAITLKTDDDQQMGMNEKMIGKRKNAITMMGQNKYRIQSTIDWNLFTQQFASVPREKLYDVLEQVVLLTKPGMVNKNTIEKYIDKSTRENYIKTATIALMSSPEFQLC